MRIKPIVQIMGIISLLLLTGCVKNKHIFVYDDYEPSAPRGVASHTGDGYVLLTWISNPEPDVVGYDVYRGTDCGGTYVYLGTTSDTFFVDDQVLNGNTYYYAVAAYDVDDFLSDLSYECIFDTPRPEGAVTLYDFNTNPNDAGFDFSTYLRQTWNAATTDIYLEYYAPNLTFYINANAGTLIQDYGYVDTLSQVGWAPQQGWSDLGYVEVILGHAYIINTWDDHYAKIRVNQIGASSVQLEWAYQVDQSNPELAGKIEKSKKQTKPIKREVLK